MFKLLLAFTMLMISFAPAPEAQAMKVRCNDPQTERGKVRIQREITRYENGKFAERMKPGFAQNPGQQIVSPTEPIKRDENFAPKPIKKGSNLHECIN